MNAEFFITLEKQLWQTLLSYDLDGFAALLADDGLLVATDGARRSKAEYLQRLPQFSFGPCTQNNFAVVQLTPDAATVTYLADIAGTSKGAAMSAKLCISSTWVQRAGRWQIAFTQDALLHD